MRVRYLRKDGKPYACFVAINAYEIDTDTVYIRCGWSLCSKEDMFSKKTAKHIALHRAINYPYEEVAESISEEYYHFLNKEVFMLAKDTFTVPKYGILPSFVKHYNQVLDLSYGV